MRALDDKLAFILLPCPIFNKCRITEDELDEMIAEIDTDGSGTVDFEGLFNNICVGSNLEFLPI